MANKGYDGGKFTIYGQAVLRTIKALVPFFWLSHFWLAVGFLESVTAAHHAMSSIPLLLFIVDRTTPYVVREFSSR